MDDFQEGDVVAAAIGKKPPVRRPRRSAIAKTPSELETDVAPEAEEADQEIAVEAGGEQEADADPEAEAEAEADVEPELEAEAEADLEPELEVEPESLSDEDVPQEEYESADDEEYEEDEISDSSNDSQQPAKPGIFARWFARRSSNAETSSPAEEPTALPPAIDETEQARLRLEAEQVVASTAKRVENLKLENLAKQFQIDENQQRLEEIDGFVAGIERSYLWRVQKAMEMMMANAKSDLSEYESAVNNVQAPKEGRLLELRKQFHRTVSIWFGITATVSAVAVLYPIVYKLEPPVWLRDFMASDFFTASLVALVVLLLGALWLIQRRGNGKRARKFAAAQLLVILIGVLIALWPYIEPTVSQRVIPFLREYIWEILSASTSVFIFSLIVALAVYYQGWSIFRREVTEQLSKLSNVIDGYVHTKQEINRLESLYKQTSDWLGILAHSLYRPWKTHPDWEGAREFENHFATFPFALRLAQAKEEKDSRMAELERLVGRRLMVQGWRSEAFADMVEQAGQEMGLQDGRFTVETLDQDLPQQSNNSRALFSRYLEHSASTFNAGKLDLSPTKIDAEGNSTLGPSDRYLVEVARKRLLKLVEETQSIVLSQARPRVEPIQDDPLLEIREDQSGIEEFDPTYSWDDFLRESLGTDEVSQPPMGVLNFSEKGQLARVQEAPSTFVITPRRLADTLPENKSHTVRVVPVGDDKARAVEIIARVDIVGPMNFSDIALLSQGVHGAHEVTNPEIWDDEAEVL